MTNHNDKRHKCKSCLKFINNKLFEDKDGYCHKCFFAMSGDKNLKKKMDKKKSKYKSMKIEYKRQKNYIYDDNE